MQLRLCADICSSYRKKKCLKWNYSNLCILQYDDNVKKAQAKVAFYLV